MRLPLLVILAAFLSAQPLSAQPLPSYDLSYYDSLECIKEKADSFAKNTLIPNKTDEAVGKSICQIAKAVGPSSHEDMAKRWDTIPSEIRWKCINALENDRKIRRIPTIDYVMLGTCIDYFDEKITQIEWLDELTGECPKKIARNMNDPCGARCRDLARVL